MPSSSAVPTWLPHLWSAGLGTAHAAWAAVSHLSLGWAFLGAEFVLLLLAVFRAIDWKPRQELSLRQALRTWIFPTMRLPLARTLTAAVFAWIGGSARPTAIVGIVVYSLCLGENLFVWQPKWLAVWRVRHRFRLPTDRQLPLWWSTGWAIGAVAAMWVVAPTFRNGLILLAAVVLIAATRSNYELLGPDTFVIGGLVLIPSLLLAIGTHQIAWLVPTAAVAYPLLVTVLLALAIVPLTIAIAGSQVIGSFIGSQTASALPLKWVGRAFLAAVALIATSLWLLGQDAGGPWLALSEVAVLLVTIAVILSISQLVVAVRPEAIAGYLADQLTDIWFQDHVLMAYQPFWGTRWVAPDPFSPIERMLYKTAASEGDDLLFLGTLDVVARRVDQFLSKPGGFTLPGGHIVREQQTAEAADSYFAQRLRAVIENAVRARNRWHLKELVDFADGISRRAYGSRLGRTADGTVPGIRLLMVLSDAGLRASLPEIIDDCLLTGGLFIESTLAEVPSSVGVPQVAPGTHFDGNSEGMGYLDGIETFLRWVEHISADAADLTDSGPVRQRAGAVLGFLFGETIGQVRDGDWADHLLFLVGQTLRSVGRLGEASGTSAFGPIARRSGTFQFVSGDERDRRVAARACYELTAALGEVPTTYDALGDGTSVEQLVIAIAPNYPLEAVVLCVALYRADDAWVTRNQAQLLINRDEPVRRLGRIRGVVADDSLAEFDGSVHRLLRPSPSLLGFLRNLIRRLASTGPP